MPDGGDGGGEDKAGAEAGEDGEGEDELVVLRADGGEHEAADEAAGAGEEEPARAVFIEQGTWGGEVSFVDGSGCGFGDLPIWMPPKKLTKA